MASFDPLPGERSMARKSAVLALVVEALLRYGPSTRTDDPPVAPAGELLLVVPRFGTVSPWSSRVQVIEGKRSKIRQINVVGIFHRDRLPPAVVLHLPLIYPTGQTP